MANYSPNAAFGDLSLIPIVLGVAGHRDIRPDDETVNKLREAMRAVFAEFEQAFPHSPKLVLSALAPGADQLAAEVALEREQWSVRAPLPFAPNIYRESTSFQVEDANHSKLRDTPALQTFEKLLNHPRVEWFVAPLPESHVRTDDEWARIARGEPGETAMTKETRETCYANSGGYIVRHCQTLLAMWDGCTLARPAGTAEVVRFKLWGKPTTYFPWTDDEPLGFDGDRGPVIVLHTPRANDQDYSQAGHRTIRIPSRRAQQEFGEKVELHHVARRLSRFERFRQKLGEAWNPRVAEQEERKADAGAGEVQNVREASRASPPFQEYDQFLAICQAIEDFNAEARRIKPQDGASGTTFMQRMDRVEKDVVLTFPDEQTDCSPCKPVLRDWYRRMLRVRETASHLTGRITPWHAGATPLLLALLILWMSFLHLYAHPVDHFDHSQPMEHEPAWLFGFLLTWPIMGLIVAWVWYFQWHSRRLDYRALSEALWVRRAWAVAGIGKSVTGSYLGQLRNELIWVRRALQHVAPPSAFWRHSFNQLDDNHKLTRLLDVESKLVKGQERHYFRAKSRHHRKAVQCRQWGLLLAILGWTILILPLGFALAFRQSNPFAPTAHLDDSLPLDPARPINLMLFLGSMLLIAGGVCVAFCERQAYESLSKHYDQIHVVFRNGARQLEEALRFSPPNLVRAQQIIEALGREALEENAQWLLLRRFRPLELPLGG